MPFFSNELINDLHSRLNRGKGRPAEIIDSETATLVASKRHPLFNSLYFLLLVFDAFCTECLARRLSLYQLKSD